MAPTAQFNPANITAAILAGGQGRRLGGRDKGLELLVGKPLIEHVITALRPQAQNIVICINRNNAQYATFAVICTDGATGFLGPLAGIATALATCDTEWLLTAPVDCPQPPADLARRLHAAAHGARTHVAVAHDGARRQPLFALYQRQLVDTATEALARDLPVWRWQDECGAVEADFSDVPNAFFNLNTAEDFQSWESSHAL
jgi:molybdopterin-guanine dinucleotide biosynthesis protein A